MSRLCKEGKLDKTFLALQSFKLLFPSHIFDNCKKTPWRIGARPVGNVCISCQTVPGEKVHLDQMQSAQLGLVPIID